MNVFNYLTLLIEVPLIAESLVSFGVNVRVDDDTGGWSQWAPALGISPDGNTIYCVFIDHRYGYHDFPGLTFTKSSDQGETWSENRMVYYGEWDAETSPRIVADSQARLHVVFGMLAYGGIMYTRSIDGGATWSVPIMISDTITTGEITRGVELAIDRNDNLYVMWSCFYEGISNDYDIFFTKSTNYGNTWLHPNVIVNDTTSCMNLFPSFCPGGSDTIYGVWEDTRLPEGGHIFFSRSIDAGITWLDSSIKVNTDPNLFNFRPKIEFLDNVLYCAWAECPGWTGYLKSSKSLDFGNTWSEPVIICNSFIQEKGPLQLGIDSLMNLCLVWPDSRQDTSDIFFSFSSDSGNSWYSPNIRVNDDTTQRPQSYADILVKGPDDICVVWADSRFDTLYGFGYGPDIYFARGSINVGINEKKALELTKIRLQISPSPFKEKTEITWIEEGTGSEPNAVSLKIYNSLGQLVRQFDSQTIRSSYRLTWDGTGQSDSRVPSGVYFIVVESLAYAATQRVVFLK